ncbi:MAG: hypothetical protein JW746_00635 [Candidatus Krumholzibacteriota bacterium]|nr:hypothetical protein [Candidatus Krumholzibacteriota bacterium]
MPPSSDKKGIDSKCIWISWHYHRRSDYLAREFGCAYYHFGTSAKSRSSRYAKSIGKTIAIIRKTRPKVLFVQNPSILLVTLAVILKPFFRYILINDLHTPYIRLPNIISKIFWALQRFCIRSSDITIVTNESFRKQLKMGRIMVLPDAMPEFDIEEEVKLEEGINILYVCTFAEDEPFGSVFKAAKLLPEGINIFVTGSYNKTGLDTSSVPDNIHLTGYLPDREYLSLLNSVDIVMVLTEQEGCIVCGGYEGVSLLKPLILSNTGTLREYFSKGAVYTRHDPRSIADGITKAISGIGKLKDELGPFKSYLRIEWQKDFDRIAARIEELIR